MKKMTSAKDAKVVKPKNDSSRFPPGWNEAKVRAVIEHYDNLTDAERAREIEEAVEIEDQTTMSVPTGLVPVIARLIEDHERTTSNGRGPKRQRAKVASRRRRSAQR